MVGTRSGAARPKKVNNQRANEKGPQVARCAMGVPPVIPDDVRAGRPWHNAAEENRLERQGAAPRALWKVYLRHQLYSDCRRFASRAYCVKVEKV